jgi:hypothetical protein
VTEFPNKIEIYLPQIVQFALHYVPKKWKKYKVINASETSSQYQVPFY